MEMQPNHKIRHPHMFQMIFFFYLNLKHGSFHFPPDVSTFFGWQ